MQLLVNYFSLICTCIFTKSCRVYFVSLFYFCPKCIILFSAGRVIICIVQYTHTFVTDHPFMSCAILIMSLPMLQVRTVAIIYFFITSFVQCAAAHENHQVFTKLFIFLNHQDIYCCTHQISGTLTCTIPIHTCMSSSTIVHGIVM